MVSPGDAQSRGQHAHPADPKRAQALRITSAAAAASRTICLLARPSPANSFLSLSLRLEEVDKAFSSRKQNEHGSYRGHEASESLCQKGRVVGVSGEQSLPRVVSLEDGGTDKKGVRKLGKKVLAT